MSSGLCSEFGLKTHGEHQRKPNQLTEMFDPLRKQLGIPTSDTVDEAQTIDTPSSMYGAPQPYIAAPKPGRNDPCFCGSGKKFKKCCGK